MGRCGNKMKLMRLSLEDPDKALYCCSLGMLFSLPVRLYLGLQSLKW